MSPAAFRPPRQRAVTRQLCVAPRQHSDFGQRPMQSRRKATFCQYGSAPVKLFFRTSGANPPPPFDQSRIVTAYLYNRNCRLAWIADFVAVARLERHDRVLGAFGGRIYAGKSVSQAPWIGRPGCHPSRRAEVGNVITTERPGAAYGVMDDGRPRHGLPRIDTTLPMASRSSIASAMPIISYPLFARPHFREAGRSTISTPKLYRSVASRAEVSYLASAEELPLNSARPDTLLSE
jgi:hypothetical protein